MRLTSKLLSVNLLITAIKCGNIQLTFPVQINGVNYNLLRPNTPQPQDFEGPPPDLHPYPTYQQIPQSHLTLYPFALFYTFYGCGDSEEEGMRVARVEVFPNPPIANANTYIAVHGFLEQDIEQGSNYAFTSRIPLWDVGVDHPETQICASEEKEGYACPILAGPVTLNFTLPYFKNAPRLIKVEAKHPDGSRIVCLKGRFRLDKEKSRGEFSQGQMGRHTQAQADRLIRQDREEERERVRIREAALKKEEKAKQAAKDEEVDSDGHRWYDGLEGLDFFGYSALDDTIAPKK